MTKYAISFKFDPQDHQDKQQMIGYNKVSDCLTTLGFTKLHSTFYIGNDSINSVDCVLAVQHLSKSIPWFYQNVRDLQMFRIEETSDLMVAL
jgi:virulence-associated protein VapD